MDSVAHFLNNPSASSRETVIFLLMTQAIGETKARIIADGFDWKIGFYLAAKFRLGSTGEPCAGGIRR